MKKLFAVLTILCLSVCSAASCSENTEAYLSDFDEALRILEKYNPFFPVIRSSVPDYDGLCKEERNLVLTRCRSFNDLYLILTDLFARIGNPGHLSMIDPVSYQEYLLLADLSLIGEESPEYRLLTDPQTQAVYAAMEFTEPAEEDWRSRFPPYVTYDPERCLLYIRIQSFRQELIERDQDVLIDAVRAHPETKHIVFDICGNGGGSDYYWANLLVAPFGENMSYEKQVFFRDDDLTRSYGFMNGAVPVSSLNDNTLPAFVEEMGLTYTLSGTIVIDAADENRRIQSDARRWVLTDEYVYSAADGFAGFCKQTGWATLIGHRTRGDGGSSAPFLVRLPESGLLMRFSAAASANRDGTLNTFYGTAPDILSKPSEHAYDTLLRVIDSLEGI